jgi:sigma-54 dependent transcriptional regulator, flagellar regulatory protein
MLLVMNVDNLNQTEESGIEYPQDVQTLRDKIDDLRKMAMTVVAEVEALGSVKIVDLNSGINIQDEMRDYEKHLIQRALWLTSGNQARAAELLGLRATTLNEKIKRYNIQAIVRH